MGEIILDPAIRNWVVLPMVLIMVLIGLGRHYLSKLMATENVMKADEARNMQTLGRAQKTRINGRFINPTAFAMRKNYFTARKGDGKDGGKGVLREKVKGGQPNPMSNPNQMTGMLKNNMTFMIPNFAMMGLISMFFSGFVLVKIPFPLTHRFKAMLQRGIELSTLDASYVSSLSWYFLVMFGMRGFLTILLGEQTDNEEEKMMQMQMGMAGGGNMAFDAAKAFKQERESLELEVHRWVLDDVEYKLLGENTPVSEGPTPSSKEMLLEEATEAPSTKRSKFSKTKKSKA